MPTHHRILSLVYNEFEALDLFGPLGAIVPRSDYYTVEFVNLHNLTSPYGIETSMKNGIGIAGTISLAEALREDHDFDTVFIPGGFGMMPLVWDPMLLKQIGQLVDRAANVFTVCTGSILLAATGRLDGRQATTNKRLYDKATPKRELNLTAIHTSPRKQNYKANHTRNSSDPAVKWESVPAGSKMGSS